MILSAWRETGLVGGKVKEETNVLDDGGGEPNGLEIEEDPVIRAPVFPFFLAKTTS